MQLEFSETQADAVRAVLEGAIAEMASEIADTDNPRFRAGLEDRRRALREVQTALGPSYGGAPRGEGGHR